eukprot:RCo023038
MRIRLFVNQSRFHDRLTWLRVCSRFPTVVPFLGSEKDLAGRLIVVEELWCAQLWPLRPAVHLALPLTVGAFSSSSRHLCICVCLGLFFGVHLHLWIVTCWI